MTAIQEASQADPPGSSADLGRGLGPHAAATGSGINSLLTSSMLLVGEVPIVKSETAGRLLTSYLVVTKLRA